MPALTPEEQQVLDHLLAKQKPKPPAAAGFDLDDITVANMSDPAKAQTAAKAIADALRADGYLK
jgi:hypothetical protein